MWCCSGIRISLARRDGRVVKRSEARTGHPDHAAPEGGSHHLPKYGYPRGNRGLACISFEIDPILASFGAVDFLVPLVMRSFLAWGKRWLV